MGFKIFMHSVRMVLGNLKQVLQITIGPALIATAATIAAIFVFGVPEEVFDEAAGTMAQEPSAGLVLSIFVIFLTVMLWIAVSWHRFILLEEYPDRLLPPFRFDRILAYLGRALLLALAAMVCFIPAMFILVGITQAAPLIGAPIFIVFFLFVSVCFYRLSIILPAAAVGRPITFSNAWAATKGETGTFITLLFVAILFQVAVQLVFTLLAFVPFLGVLLVIVASFLILPMINVSILTTLYGVYIEKRELN